jgi:hypothetical protein
MNRYILLSFLFMGWTFYQLSGGADFEPPSAKQVAIAEPIDEPKVQTEPSVAELTAPEPVAKPEPVVLPEASAQLDRVAEPEPSNVAPELVVAEIDTETPAPTGIVISADWSTDLESQTVGTDTVFSLASLGQLSETVTEDPIWGIRTVKGTEVNVRSGPGTTHSVVSRLIGGTEVQVLNDPGEGWVKMRHLESETVGWMSASLLTP